jgi:hypothetical protein
MNIESFQTITINYEDGGDKSELIITESLDNNGYVKIKQGMDAIVFPKELVDTVVRNLAKFSK